MEDIDQLHAPGKYFTVPTGQEADCSVCLTLVHVENFSALSGIEHRYPGRSVHSLVTVLAEIS